MKGRREIEQLQTSVAPLVCFWKSFAFNWIRFCTGYPDDYTRGDSETNSSGAENKSSITMPKCCGLLSLILSQWSYIYCVWIHGSWIISWCNQTSQDHPWTIPCRCLQTGLYGLSIQSSNLNYIILLPSILSEVYF